MELRQACTLIGSILFMSGLFRHFHVWAGPFDGMIVLILVILALILAWRKHYRGLWFVSAAAIGSLIYTIVTFQANMKRVQEEQGIQTLQLSTTDWAIPLAGIVLLIVAALLKNQPARQNFPPIKNPLLIKLTWIFSVTILFLPLFVIEIYPVLKTTGFATAIYSISVAFAASFWETQWSRRLLFAAPVIVLGLMLCATFDVIMIMVIALAAGASSVGYIPTSIKAKWWKNVLYRFSRMLVSLGMLIFTALLHLPSSGRCPGGGGDITEVFITFAIMTYFPICAMITIDSIAKLLDKQQSRERTTEQSTQDTVN